MIAKTAPATGVQCGGLTTAIPVRPAAAFQSSRRQVLVRFRDDKENQDLKTYEKTDTKVSLEEVRELYEKTESPFMGEFDRRTAELRADLGSATPAIHMMQTFDGPAPETINGRLAMLGVLTGLFGEASTGLGLLEQTGDHPLIVFASFVIISIATYVPLVKGYTRKEPFANNLLGLNWTPKAENWNGRLAMMGFLGMVLTEAVAGCNTLQAYGLQPHNLGH
jgi:hypothetical protein